MELRKMYERSIDEFGDQIEWLENESSRNDKKAQIAQIAQESLWRRKIEILAGQRFDDIGIAKKTAIKSVARAYGKHDGDVESDVAEIGSVTEAVREYGDTSSSTSDRIDELYTALESLEDLRGDKQIAEFASLLQKFSSPWVVTFAVVGDLSIGVSHSTICSGVGGAFGYTKDEIQRGRALIPDTAEFVEAVKNDRVIDSPTAGEPFAPMKAKSVSEPDDLEDWVAQIKLDGYRCIIHVEADGTARAFSSALNEQTEKLPELADIDWPDGEWIFDAEVMAADDSYESTSERMQRKGSSELPHTMNFWVFDVLVADGEDVSREPFTDRMDTVIAKAPMDERVIPVFAHDDIDEAREDALDNGYEGTILKHKDHEFEFGKRSKNWIKDKITTDTADLRVSGFIQGEGRHSDRLGALTLETEDWVALGKVGTGFTDQQRKQIWDNKDDWTNAIVEIKFDAEEGYKDGLRFPAFVTRRDDKLQANDEQRIQNIAGGN